MRSVLVLNASYAPLHTVDIQHAIRMVHRGVAVIEEAFENLMFGTFPMPKVLRLIKYIKDQWKYNRPVRYSKNGVLKRDKGLCAYCGGHATTIDHIVPRALGGMSTWLNTVSACKPCNNKKDSKTLEQIGWRLRYQPFEPKVAILAEHGLVLA